MGAGDVDKLMEIKTKDIVAILGPKVADIAEN